ncbi:MAG: choice-of-anchor V domain-containing protein [Phaeodactylibacter sp.]|uniref:T9SS type A sorting domain-containing protein n=1 Tax=Phaeodactylibacter sp. TaxID=1940289 RepID=UPI0032F0745D
MKLRLLYTLFALAGGAFLFLNNSSGAGAAQGQDRTGSPLSSATCGACHGGNNFSPTIELQVLKDGEAVAAYTPGEVYTMRVSAGFSGNPAAFGFQAVALTGENNAQGGDFQNPPSGTQITIVNGREYPEHSQRSPNSAFEVEWIAPEAGTGDVRFYSSVLASNSAGGSSGDGVASLDTPVVLTEDMTSSTAGPSVLNAEVQVFPNPAKEEATLQISEATAGTYQVEVISAQGQLLYAQSVQLSGAAVRLPLDLSAQPGGLYLVRVSNGKQALVRRLIRQ